MQTESKLPSMLEPKTKNRWVVTLPELFELPSFLICETTRPIIIPKYSEMEVNGVLSRLVVGIECAPLNIVFRDPVNPSTAQKLWKIFIGISQDTNGINQDISDELKKKFKPFRKGFDYKLELLDPAGAIIEKWDVLGCYITCLDFGDLSYSSNDPIKCKITVQPSRVILLY